ncbi:histidine kinase [Gordoniibacillus kamchatkensis]|uniref:histidine kinase n=1 Tax=Gordoniibacillus kamchatkensis TaxID=1590651 RepID=A0ABR5ADF2_9BACL|nr:HAMP domain-containing sensor histidine kinase [Paenibacillus sp. VKM B-2647]KIL39074.1 histidine kinase [Paenibacillus sp. VKM B-2647]
MSIKTRLLLSYIAMTFIPVVLFALVFSVLSTVLFQNAAGTGDRKGPPAVWQMANARDELIAGVKFMARTDPDRFADSAFVQNTDKQLNEVQAGLVVVKNGQAAFVSPFVAIPDLLNELQGVQAEQNHRPWGNKVGGRFTAVKYDVAFGDHSAGTVYVLSDLRPLFDSARKFFPLLVLSLLVVIGLTNGVLTFLVSRSLIKPLFALKHAAEQFKEGNLDHQVRLNRKDEIGELGAAFEEMRSRLNDSIRLQLQYEENRKQLISNISHDLKTPITGIKACVEGIQDGIADTGPMRDKYVSMIAKKTDEMDRLIDELMLYSKLDLNRLPFHLEPVDFAAYLHDCVEELRLDPRLAGVRISFTRSGNGPVSVMADREKLRRVVVNIIDNSLKYMDKEHKEIAVELIEGETEATVRIRDNGPGIDSAALPHIFDRFYRAEPSRNTATGGSGLGLAIVKQIVEGQGGSVGAESRSGEGTTVYFSLPIKHGGEQS